MCFLDPALQQSLCVLGPAGLGSIVNTTGMMENRAFAAHLAGCVFLRIMADMGVPDVEMFCEVEDKTQ